jgi:hypothetical protein
MRLKILIQEVSVLRRTLLFLIVGLSAVGLLLLLGCSDDDENGTGPTQQGDPNDPNFQFIVEQTLEETGDFGPEFEISFGLLEQIGIDVFGARKIRPLDALGTDVDTITSIVISSFEFTDTYWFVFTFTAQMLEIDYDGMEQDTTIIDVMGTDSVQFLFDGIPVDSADLSPDVNGLKVNVHVDVEATEDDDTMLADMHHRIDLVVGYNNNDSLGLINATQRDTVAFRDHDGADTCDVVLTEHTTITDLVMFIEGDHEGDCPPAGRVEVTAGIDLECTGEGGLNAIDLEGAWTVIGEINGNTRTITVIHGNVRWSVTEPNTDC